jgi:hypothetical protein
VIQKIKSDEKEIFLANLNFAFIISSEEKQSRLDSHIEWLFSPRNERNKKTARAQGVRRAGM